MNASSTPCTTLRDCDLPAEWNCYGPHQIVSFAYGNVKLHTPAITRGDVKRMYEQLHQAET
jgi:hypothetical protein